MRCLYIIFSFCLLSACLHVRPIGRVNMISTRNIDEGKEYVLLKSYAGGSKKELKKSRGKSINDAVDNTVRSVPNGEYLMNVKIYRVSGFWRKTYYAVEGDVWGRKGEVSFKGFKIGDKVQFKTVTHIWLVKKQIVFLTGIITSFKNDKTCYVKIEGSEKTVELLYDDITKVN